MIRPPPGSTRTYTLFPYKTLFRSAKGIDEIACTAVNDIFVLSGWAKANDAEGKVAMLADGNGTFAKAVGLEMDGSGFGLGTRGQRFSMIVNDGVVEELNVEAPGDRKSTRLNYSH